MSNEVGNRRSTNKKLKSKQKTHVKQPKKIRFMTTEVRSSKGGAKFEIILAEPVAQTPPKRPPSPNKVVSAEEIEEKLKAAEDRRKSLTASQLAALSAKLAKIEEARQKNDEQEKLFIKQTEEALKQKIASHEQNRESHISELKAKLKEHLEGVEKSRQSLEQQAAEVAAAIEDKLKTAANQRDENIKKMLEKLKEHEEKTKIVRDLNHVKINQLKNQIDSKLTSAEKRRLSINEALQQKLKIHEQHVEMVRKNKEKLPPPPAPESEETASSAMTCGCQKPLLESKVATKMASFTAEGQLPHCQSCQSLFIKDLKG